MKKHARIPYVVYDLVSKNLPGKGMGYALKEAIQAFVTHHGLEASVTLPEITTDHCRVRFAIFDNGNSDLNMRALREHVENSGRMPSKADKRPTFSIKPVSPIEYVPESLQTTVEREQPPTRSEEQWGRTLGAKEDVIKRLEGGLAERQHVISRLTNANKDLEKRLAQSTQVTFDTPLSAILQGYVRGKAEILLQAFADYRTLAENDDLEIFGVYAASGESPTFAKYVHDVSGLKFETDDEARTWIEEMKMVGTWRDSPRAKKLLEERTKAESDVGVIEEARNRGASPAMLKAMEGALRERTPAKIERQIKALESQFAREKTAYEGVGDVVKRYAALEEVWLRVAERREQKADFPVIVHVNTGEQPSLAIHTLSLDVEGPLHRHLRDVITSVIPTPSKRVAYAATATIDNNNVARIKIEPTVKMNARRQSEHYKEMGDLLSTKLSEDQLLNMLGIKTRVLYVAESV